YGERRGPRAPGSGAGIIGMRERTELLDGTFTAGPVTTPDGSSRWRVEAQLPANERTLRT
ncbi:two-component sensor histidine kinase, partial [Streptomyces hundungensis]